MRTNPRRRRQTTEEVHTLIEQGRERERAFHTPAEDAHIAALLSIIGNEGGEPSGVGWVQLNWYFSRKSVPEKAYPSELKQARAIRRAMGRPADESEVSWVPGLGVGWITSWTAPTPKALEQLVARARKLTGVELVVWAASAADYPPNGPTRERQRRGVGGRQEL
jgi:hypothetical protein